MEKPSGYYPVPQKQPRNRVKTVRLGVLREQSPRSSGTRRIWTGLDSGNEVVYGDLLLDKGIIQKVGTVDNSVLAAYADLVILDAAGAWVSPGIIDLHSHLGVFNTPVLRGAADVNSLKGLILPWLRSLDGLNTHDDCVSFVHLGRGNHRQCSSWERRCDRFALRIVRDYCLTQKNYSGGQAFVIKLRPTAERSSSAMLLEPPFSLNGTYVDPSARPRWRQMKHACGENPSRVYSGTRMDTQWAFRQGYNTARLIKEKQDAYCAKAVAGQWKDLGNFPEDLQWEALVDVLRGRVKVHNHCYEGVDIDGMVRLTNEFKFSIAAFHHAHEAYLVPDLIKKAYGHPPAIAIFATTGRYKREAYRGSEFAPRILADSGLNVVMKSDHPVLNSRYLLFEAQQAHYFGLPANLALASVTSTPARVMGQDHRIGRLIEGFDADVVVWDSHPLSLGAAPKQVFIDGIAQLENPHTVEKSKSAQRVPATPDFEKEIADANQIRGNVGSILLKDSKRGISEIVCRGEQVACASAISQTARYIDLEGGSISPGLISYGSPLGLSHIPSEATGEVFQPLSGFFPKMTAPEGSTSDGEMFQPLSGFIPKILDGAVIKAADGLLFATRDALLAYRSGVTSAVTAPTSEGFLSGLSTVFSTVAAHKLVDGAVLQGIATLRGLLLGGGHSELAQRFGDVTAGKIPLVVDVESADITLTGATEAHLLAKEIGQAGVGVIVHQRPFPFTWQQRRILPGPPLTKSSAIAKLVAHNVTVGISIGITDAWAARNARFDAAWAGLESDGALSRAQTLALASSNLETLLGVKNIDTDLVANSGGFRL
ncbi:carbohydrate esterase family 9 protein [Mycena rebaudengoi]|nr:carbohydrate esterase family 9 protein [Mycena rebaudengoi]